MSVLGDRFRSEELISECGLFSLYRATSDYGDVFVRVLRPPFDGEKDFVERLGGAIQDLVGQRIVGCERVIEFSGEGSPQIISEAFGDGTLHSRLHKLSTFSVSMSVGTAIAILESLVALHEKGIVHGELSAKSIAMDSAGTPTVLLPGVWRAYSFSETAGNIVLSQIAPYLAPEISKGAMPSVSSDIYAVGSLLYEMLTGRHPFHAETSVAMAMKHVTDSVPSVRMMSPSVPHVLDEIIKKALSKDPSERYTSAKQMGADLLALQDALRFGKTLTWPIQRDEPEPVQDRAAETEGGTKAVPPYKPAKPKRERVEYESDVPGWLKLLIWVFTLVIGGMVVAWAVFNMSRPKALVVPELARMSTQQAKARLEAMGLRLQVISRESSEDVAADRILRTNPATGAKIYEGRAVQVIVSTGSKFVEVPELKGLTLDRAKAMASSVNLDIADRVENIASSSVDAGLVIDQTPKARAKVERFTAIRVRVSSGKKEEQAPDPELNLKYLYTLTIKLTDIDQPVNLRVDMTDARGVKTVHESRREAGEEVEVSAEGYGKKVTFRILYDGEVVKTVERQAEP